MIIRLVVCTIIYVIAAHKPLCACFLLPEVELVPGFAKPMPLLGREAHRSRGLTVYVRHDFSACRQYSYECRCCKIIVIRICSSSHNFYVFGVYRNLNLSDKIFNCSLAAISTLQSVGRKALFCLLAT